MSKKKEPILADLIRGQMGILNISQRKLAKKVGYSTATINNWCNHPERLSLDDFQLLNAVLHLDGKAFMKYAGFEVNE